MTKGVEMKLGIEASAEEVNSLVRRLDQTGDGYINYLEFVKIAVRGARGNRRVRRRRQAAGHASQLGRKNPRSNNRGGGAGASAAQKAARRGRAARQRRKNAAGRRRHGGGGGGRHSPASVDSMGLDKNMQVEELFSLCQQLLRVYLALKVVLVGQHLPTDTKRIVLRNALTPVIESFL